MAIKRFTQGFPWQPNWDLYRDGITFSLLCQFIVCRERFRLQCVYSLREAEGFRSSLEYGNMWHAMLEAFGAVHTFEHAINAGLAPCADALLARYPEQASDVKFWVNMAHDQFALYIPHWQNMQKVRQPYLQEQVFKVPYAPYGGAYFNGQSVPLRGKLDEMFKEKIPKSKKLSNVLQENKVKGDPKEELIEDMLQCDLQTTIYLTVAEALGYGPVDCIVYNVIRNPLGGLFHIQRKKGGAAIKGTGQKTLPETDEEYQKRAIQQVIDNPDGYFFRKRVYLSNVDKTKFVQQVLDPHLWQLMQWWESIKNNPADPWFTYAEDGTRLVPNPHHWMRPYGVYDPIAQGYRGKMHDYLFRGETHKYVQLPDPFPELGE